MAALDPFLSFLRKWEGGVAHERDDRGGLTFQGVTLPTLQRLRPAATAQDLLHLSQTQWELLVDKLFWQRWQADRIESQSVAEMLVDWTWMSGCWGVVLPQAMLRVVPDGKVGPRTLQAVNESDAYIFWSHLKESRRRYFLRLVQQHPAQRRFLRGWLRRLSDLSFE